MDKADTRDHHLGIFGRLLRDARGNTIVIFAASLFPLLALFGGGIDMSRLYLTKARVQQACDAGALAGRKAMGGSTWTTGTASTETTALAMFDGNFKQGDYGTGTRTRSYSESGGSVNGTATVAVPMTLMRVFNIQSKSVTVNCTAKMEIPNTDVMFVLDVTGSMSGTKIAGLKKAVKCFYEALMKVNTTEKCVDNGGGAGSGDPTGTTYTQTAQIRIGFVPYSVNVNVGKLLPNAYLANNWTYQSRQWQQIGYTTSTSNGNWSYVSGSRTSNSYSNKSSCPNNATYNADDSYTQGSSSTASDGTITTTYTQTRIETGWSLDDCDRISRNNYSYDTTTYNNYTTRRTITETKTPQYGWAYKDGVTFDVSGLKAGGSTWNNSVSLPLGTNGASTSVAWSGCIEERQTVKNSDQTPGDEWDPIPAAALDMNIDTAPSASDPTTQWGPMLGNAVWARYDANGGYAKTQAEVDTTDDWSHSGNSFYCPTAAKKLQQWNTASPFETYVNSLTASGNTYHDIGMIWGARLISPTGIFAAENTNLNNIQRHIIFMTDGDTQANVTDYSAYGIHWWDRRQTTYAPTSTNLEDIVNARLQALCTAIKNKNITLWVISYGTDVTSTTEDNLRTCAKTGKYYSASDSATLISQFQQIASSIAKLRLTN